MCFDCCEIVVCCVNCFSNVTVFDLPIEIIEDFIFPLLTLEDIRNLGRIRIKRLKDIASKYLEDNKSIHIMVTTPTTVLPYYPYDDTTEIIHLKRTRRKKVWSMSTWCIDDIAVITNRRPLRGFGNVLAYTEVQGTNKSFYYFDNEKNEWIESSWINIGDTFSIESDKKEALQRFMPWLKQRYTKKNKGVLSVFSSGEINAIGEILDFIHRNPDNHHDIYNNICDEVMNAVIMMKSDIVDWNKPSNEESFKPPKHFSEKLSTALTRKAFSKTPTTWILKKMGRANRYLGCSRYTGEAWTRETKDTSTVFNLYEETMSYHMSISNWVSI